MATAASSVFREFDEYSDDRSNNNNNNNGGGGNHRRPPRDDNDNITTSSAIAAANHENEADHFPSAEYGSNNNNQKKKNSQLRLFTPKYQYSTKNNPLCGICLVAWISILQQRWQQIEWTVYWPRLLFVTFMSVVNSILGVLDTVLYGTLVESAHIHPRPVFLLGHPRTGTTLLHSLLALDEDQFATCSTFCAGFPSSFLSMEGIGKILFQPVMDDHRPMDNVPLGFDLPQEDELATNVLSAGTSPYMPLFLMKQEADFRPYYAFDDDSGGSSSTLSTKGKGDDERLEPSVMAAARKQWTEAFLTLLRKLTVRDQKQRTPRSQQQPQCRRLLLKSPVHTARIPLLLQLFPDAQFVYIHRHPYDVLRSAMHMADTTYWYTYLNTPSDDQIMEFILRQYEILYERYEKGRQQILDRTTTTTSSPSQPQQQLIEVSFDELSQDPIATVQRIYSNLGWTLTPTMKASLQDDLGDVQSYKRNRHRELSPRLKQIVNQRWGPSFARFGYAMDDYDYHDDLG